MVGLLDGLLNIVAPKGKPRAGGATLTPTYNPNNAAQVLTYPTYLEHTNDIFTTRQSTASPDLLKIWFEHDPDISSAVNGYLTLANTDMITWVEDINGEIDKEATWDLHQLIIKLSFQTDYTQGFVLKQNLHQLNAELRYMGLLRGAIGIDLITDKAGAPDNIRQIDMTTIRWYEKQPGVYKPGQLVPGRTDPLLLDQPNFFVGFYRRNPTSIYTQSPFVSAINTIAARTQVIFDLYRIMRFTGYPRMEIKILEEVLRKNAPLDISSDVNKMKIWVSERIQEISASFQSMSVDQAIVHSDSLEFKILNDKGSGVALDIKPIVETLNHQNQASLKTMSTILGRGSSGVNTGSVEARLAAMFADELNEPLVDLYQRMFSFILHQQGYQGFARVVFRPAELRPWTELEPQLVLKSQRLRQDLSDGIITDAEYTLEMYGRLPNDKAPDLSGTGFLSAAQPAAGPNPTDTVVDGNKTALGRSVGGSKTKQPNANAPKSNVA